MTVVLVKDYELDEGESNRTVEEVLRDPAAETESRQRTLALLTLSTNDKEKAMGEDRLLATPAG